MARFIIPRQTFLHTAVRKIGYALLFPLPYAFKYRVGKWLRRHRLPYRFVEPGSTVIQVGAPWDVLRSGRSRAAYFGVLAGENGRVIVVEPEPRNVEAMKSFLAELGLRSVEIVPVGAWSHATRLRFLSRPDHPATNIVEVIGQERQERDLSHYEVSEISVDALDNIIERSGLGSVDLVSITTNGSESRILSGLRRHLGRVRYISVINGAEQDPIFAEFGFAICGHDDRGFTLRNTRLTGAAD